MRPQGPNKNHKATKVGLSKNQGRPKRIFGGPKPGILKRPAAAIAVEEEPEAGDEEMGPKDKELAVLMQGLGKLARKHGQVYARLLSAKAKLPVNKYTRPVRADMKALTMEGEHIRKAINSALGKGKAAKRADILQVNKKLQTFDTNANFLLKTAKGLLAA